MGLNRNDQPVTITLPELLHSRTSVITTEHPHLKIEIPGLPPDESGHMTLPLGRMHTIPVAASPETPLKPRISLTAEVNNLLIQAMADNLSHKSEHSAIGKVAMVEAAMTLSHKLEASPPPANISSQMSAEEGEASLESNLANISPVIVAHSSHSASLLVDPAELQMDANLATDHMVCMKRSMDLKRQQVIWELGLLMHQNETEEAASIEKAKVVHSQEVLNAEVDCTKVVHDTKVECAKAVLEAKGNYRAAVQEAKMVRGNCLQEAKTAYSKALGEAAAVKSAQSTILQREHVRLMQELEEQAMREESKSCHYFLSACQAILHHVLQPLMENLITSYHVLLGQSPPSAPLARASPVEEQPSATASPRPVPKQSPQPKRWHPLPEPWGSLSIDKTSPRALPEGPPSSKRQETPIWISSLKLSCAEAFSQDSDIVKEARSHFFSNHSCIWVHDGTHDLSDIFKDLTESAGLLGEAIYEIQPLEDNPLQTKSGVRPVFWLPNSDLRLTPLAWVQ